MDYPKTKSEYIDLLRNEAEKIYSDLLKTKFDLKKKASEMNKRLKIAKDFQSSKILETAKIRCWQNEKLLNELLLLTYSSYIVMLEYRNEIWPYEYMTFSRRIGELWEPFCKLPFFYPVNELKIIDVPAFQEIQDKIQKDAITFIESLALDEKTKNELKEKYEILWTMVDSGGINLNLDLHFEQNKIHYNCDFKSGFSSNEKGNTNRLLLVASIFKSLGQNEKQIIFVRQQEKENNHYLQTLKNSKLWDIYCADECYTAIKNFTGFSIREWLDKNTDWKCDISNSFKKHLEKNDLLKYLTW